MRIKQTQVRVAVWWWCTAKRGEAMRDIAYRVWWFRGVRCVRVVRLLWAVLVEEMLASLGKEVDNINATNWMYDKEALPPTLARKWT